MLGLDWTELALILVVAVVVIGPKDLPDAVRGIARFIQKLRRMAGEFQTQVDEVVKEAKLEDVRNQINEIRSFDFRSAVEKELDKDGSLRRTFTEDPIGNPLRDSFATPATPPGGTAAGAADMAAAAGAPPPAPAAAAPAEAPAFVPPGVAAPAAPPVAFAPAAPPAFVPPAPVPAAPVPPAPAAAMPAPAPAPTPAATPAGPPPGAGTA